MLDVQAQDRVDETRDLPAALFRAQERIRELEREVSALQGEIRSREEQTQEAFAELARFRKAFANAWQSLRVMRNRARDAYSQCEQRLSDLLSLDALRGRVAELEQSLAQEQQARRRAEEEVLVRVDLQEFLSEQLEAQRERMAALETALQAAGYRARVTSRPNRAQRPEVHAFLVD